MTFSSEWKYIIQIQRLLWVDEFQMAKEASISNQISI